MSSASSSASVDFAQYGEVFARRWRVIACGLAMGVLVAAGAILMLPKTYTSTASVLVAPTGETGTVANGRTTGEINLDTEAQIVTSTVVARAAGELLSTTEDPRDLARHVIVTVPPNTSVLNIAFEAEGAREARDGAKAFADAYLENRSTLATAANDQRISSANDRIDRLNDQIARLDSRIADLEPGDSQLSALEAQLSQWQQQVSELRTQAVELDLGEINPGDVITQAQVPRQPSDPNLKLVLVSGILIGLLGGVIVAFLRDRADRSIRDRRDLERIGLDALVPTLVVPPHGEIASSLNSRYRAESMRRLRNALLAQMPDHRGSILVAATTKGLVGSAVALNLAATLARSGLSVILASADTQEGSGRPVGGDGRGLAEVLQGRAEVDDVLEDVPGQPGMRTLSPGRDGSLYTELVQSEQVAGVLESIKSRCDVLVVDVAPTSINADAQTLAAWFDGVVIVTQERASTSDDVLEAVDQFRHVSANVLGAVVVSQDQGDQVPAEDSGGPQGEPDGRSDIDGDNGSKQ